MIDFDKLVEEYLKGWLVAHKDEYTADETEDMLPELYEEWVTKPCKAIGGVTPEEYFARIKDPEKLVGMFVESSSAGGACSLLSDRIAETPECAELLIRVVLDGKAPEIVISAMNMLEEMGAEQPFSEYAKWLTDKSVDEGVAEKAAEILKDHAAAVKEQLIAASCGADLKQKQVIADVLVEAGRDERTFALLKELFLSGENIPYTAGLLGKYGDERAAEFLYPALDDCNYLEFIEIRNAIETMGGVVDDSYRDFTDDEYYKAIKHLA